MVTKDMLKQEIDALDESCFALAFNVLRQFPHIPRKSVSNPPNSAEKLADLAQTASQWPLEIRALAGAWQDFPIAEALRKTEGQDIPREDF
jgi:hypothetical protein